MIVSALVALALSVSGPAPTTADPLTAPAASPTAVPQAAPPPKRATRYCAIHQITGTRIPRRDCRTRSDWMKQGYDPLAAK